MVGVVVISHGKLAEGMVDSAKMFFGDTLEQVEHLCFLSSDNPDEFDLKLKEKIAKVSSGDGVVVFADLMGGTPANRSAYCLAEDVQVITGANLTMFIELLGYRQAEGTKVDEDLIDHILQVGKDGIVNLNRLMSGGKK